MEPKETEYQSYVHAERASVLYTLVGAFFIPVFIGLLEPSWLRSLRGVIVLVVLMVPAFFVFRFYNDWILKDKPLLQALWDNIRPLPAGLVYGTDLKKYSFAWATATLVFVNSYLFFMLPQSIVREAVFLPYGDPSVIQTIASFFTSAFLHASFWHLAGNMVFLWTFGATVEPRIGSRNFIVIYFLCIVTSNFLVLVLLHIQNIFLESAIATKDFHSLGASGAIAGVMGIFVVRCFFARVTVNLPFAFFPIFSMPFRIQGTFLIGFFFAMDLSGSMVQYSGSSHSRTNFWAHVGGYLGGFCLGYLMKLHKAASKEAVHVKAERVRQEPYHTKEATRLYQDILQQNPEDVAALEYFLELNKYNPEKAQAYYVRLVEVLANKDFPKAPELFEDHYPNWISGLSGEVLLRLGSHFRQTAKLAKARLCFEFSSEKEGPWQAKALLSLGRTFEDIGNRDMAKKMFKDIIIRFPNTPFQEQAQERLEQMGQESK
jgi:membrane associated rhomboid family serine protease